ncbi:MAG: ATP-binding protein [Ferruginibacter sp.]
MKKIVKVLLLLLVPSILNAQNNPYWDNPGHGEISSMRTAFDNEANDTTRMYIGKRLGLYYFEVNTDSSLYYIENELLLAKKLKLKLWEADALVNLGYVSSLMSNNTNALSSLLTALQIGEDKSSEENIWLVSYFTKDKNPQSARLVVVASTLHDLGHLYGWKRNPEKQLAYYLEALTIAAQVKDLALLSLLHMNIGNAYYRVNKLDSALIYERKALDYSDSSGFKKYRGLILARIGYIKISQGQNDEAKKYLLSSIKTSEQQSVFSFLSEASISLANLFFKTGNLDSGFYYARKGLEVSKSAGYSFESVNAYKLLSSIYEARGKTDSAFKYQKLAFAISDSLFNNEKNNQFQNINLEEQQRLQEKEKENIKRKNQTRTYSLLAGLGVMLLIGIILYRNNRQKQNANKVLEGTLTHLKSTQSQLIQSEKMASLGELTAGIAHEIQNPLNFINNFSEINKELLEEMQDELDKGNVPEAKQLATDVINNEEKINHHGKRADAIVKGMLQHSRSSSGVKEPTDINALCDEYLRLSYHGLRAKDKSFNATIKTDFDHSIGNINIIPQDIGRVILNLLTNAFYVVDERRRALSPVQGIGEKDLALEKSSFQNLTSLYDPTVSISTKKVGDKVLISVTDNGNGIPAKVLDKIFQPFFTTKPTGQGTGLGLSLSYDIVKVHGGTLQVETSEGEGTTFHILLPSR